ncbi:T9SS type A sorting domain-containing protein [Dyadobacter sp. CY107]|uniref:T9SS type A sorting domain-containing protein n=1 Tax=Dyadobacter fanqingshengii TaxID=2906443 RepID=UPI001F2574BD|nr:T9SS type A sorting domain-containing protein [Dyadobacter fanqingshengii]MCF2502602.1 T9SS type A sorting domain-containing protein [Dyadobacter fanqingshengii]
MKTLYFNGQVSICKRLILLLVLVNMISVSFAQQRIAGSIKKENARVNADFGTIVISKKTQPEIAPGVNFTFFTEIPSIPSFVLNDDPSFISMQDVGMGEDNTMWAIAAPESGTGNGNIYHRPAGSSAWVQAGGVGTRIDVSLRGNSVLVNEAGAVFTWNSTLSAFQLLSASINAVDVGVSAGTIQNAFVLVRNFGCHTLARSIGSGFFTQYPNICGTRLDVAPDGSVYVLSELAGEVYRVTFSGDAATIAQTFPSLAFRDITVAADGKVWAVNSTTSYYLENGAWVADPNSSGIGFGSNPSGLSAGADGDTPILTLNAEDDLPTSDRGQLIQRRENGTWMNSHKVRQSGTANSIILNVAPGTYRVEENPTQPAWKLVGINTSGGTVVTNLDNRNANITVGAGQTVHVEFVNAGYDYGDAAASYGTKSADNGAVHQVNPALTLGTTIDIDADGDTGSPATGDDNTGTDDEDGIASFPVISAAGSGTFTNYTVKVSARNETALTANLCGWIDWNNNGTFESGEGVCTTLAPAGTEATLVWPAVIMSGFESKVGTFARFRLTTDVLTTGGMTGMATNGEVEDYFLPFSDAMPVTLITFEGSTREHYVALKWSTAEETNADRFEIEHSINGKTWNVVGTVVAKGESSVQANYTFEHNTPLKDRNFYRLRMIDHDKTFSLSKIISVIFDKTSTLTAYPNPANNRIVISSDELVKQVTLHAVSGAKVFESQQHFHNGIDVSKLSQGMYIMSIIQFDGTVSTQRVLVAR